MDGNSRHPICLLRKRVRSERAALLRRRLRQNRGTRKNRSHPTAADSTQVAQDLHRSGERAVQRTILGAEIPRGLRVNRECKSSAHTESGGERPYMGLAARAFRLTRVGALICSDRPKRLKMLRFSIAGGSRRGGRADGGQALRPVLSVDPYGPNGVRIGSADERRRRASFAWTFHAQVGSNRSRPTATGFGAGTAQCRRPPRRSMDRTGDARCTYDRRGFAGASNDRVTAHALHFAVSQMVPRIDMEPLNGKGRDDE
jgi:hypothetical protein